MTTQDFWKYFEKEAEPKLEKRAKTFRLMFEYLDQQSGPILIIETGVARQPDNWAGDGQSTVLFDRYVTARGPDSHVHAVDISADSVVACRGMVGNQTTVHLQDSVKFLDELARDADGLRPNLVIAPSKIAGKGRLLAEYANQIGVLPYFAQYQAGWIGL